MLTHTVPPSVDTQAILQRLAYYQARKLQMKKIFSLLIVLIMMGSILPTTVSAAQTGELGQLKICKVAGSGVTQGQLFSFTVDGDRYNVPAGPSENGYCVLAGQY